MSDFSQLCPLFSTGVYNEITFPEFTCTGLSTTNNALVGAVPKATQPGSFKFQRTVVVTAAYLRKTDAAGTKTTVKLTRHAATGTAAGTVFASLAITITTTKNPLNRWKKMTLATAKTFLAADVLGITTGAKMTDGGKAAVIIRYREK